MAAKLGNQVPIGGPAEVYKVHLLGEHTVMKNAISIFQKEEIRQRYVACSILPRKSQE